MPDATIQTALANEARRQELRQKVATLRGASSASAAVTRALVALNADTSQQLSAAQAELLALEAGAGPGVTAEFGPKSPITQMLETERFAAKSAVIDYVKANPACTAAQAIEQWNAAAVASHPEFAGVLQSGEAMQALYAGRLAQMALITAATWEAHRGWIIATDKDTIMGL